MFAAERNPLLFRIFRKLGNPLVCEILETVQNRRYTLEGLSRRLGKGKNLICMRLSDLHALGIIEKRVIKGRMRYFVLEGRILRHIRKMDAIAHDLEEYLALGGSAPPRLPPRSNAAAYRTEASPSGAVETHHPRPMVRVKTAK
jgi:hypothetical protein